MDWEMVPDQLGGTQTRVSSGSAIYFLSLYQNLESYPMDIMLRSIGGRWT